MRGGGSWWRSTSRRLSCSYQWRSIYAEEVETDVPERWRDAVRGLESRPWVNRAMVLDLVDYLPNDCLAKIDIASMSHGLEVRSPLLDHRVVELACRMPGDLKWRRRWGRVPVGKAILRDLFSGGARSAQSAIRNPQSSIPSLPQSILTRRKMGFGVPVGGGWRGSTPTGCGESCWTAARGCAGLVLPSVLESYVAEHTSHR